MAEKSTIEWTDTTWNPVTGCTKVSAGCANCYAARFSERFRGVPGHPFENGFDLTLRPERLLQPLGWKKPRGGIDRMNKFWGDESWKAAAYAEDRQHSFFGSELVKQDNEQIAAAFRDRLSKVARFGFVPKPLPMRNSKNAVVYYLFFASPKAVAEKIITYIFRKYE